eukprot:697641-Prorocentrum_minimum.AAC.1
MKATARRMKALEPEKLDYVLVSLENQARIKDMFRIKFPKIDCRKNVYSARGQHEHKSSSTSTRRPKFQ